MELKDNSQRAKWAIWSLSAFGAVLALFVLSGFLQLNLYERIYKLGGYSAEEVSSNGVRHMIVMLMYILTYVMAIVFFIMWFRRAYFNLHLISPSRMSYSEGWAAGAWFVPLLNIIRPYQIMKEIWYETFSHINEDDRKNKSVIIGFWWVLFIIISIYARLVARSDSDMQLAEFLTKQANTNIAAILTFIPLFLIIKIIRELSKAEEVLKEKYHTLDITSHLIDDNTTKAY